MKLLNISHDNRLWGAPRSLAGIVAQLSETTDWEMQLIVRRRVGSSQCLTFASNIKTTFWQPSPMPCPSLRMILGGIRRFKLISVVKMLKARICACFEVSEARYQRSIVRDIKKWKPDVIYSNTVVNSDVLLALGIEAPVVVHVRELDWSLKELSPCELRVFQTIPHKYLCVSNAVRTNLVDNYEIPPERCYIVPVGIDVGLVMDEAAQKNPRDVRDELGLTGNDFLITICGYLDRRKGWEYIAEACQYLSKEQFSDGKPYFLWVGGGPDRVIFEKAMRDSGWGDRIYITGITHNPYIYLAAGDLHLMPSLDDPFPRVNLEAACLGKPVVAFRPSGGSAEFVGSDAGVVIDEFDSEELARVIADAANGKIDLLGLGQRASSKVRELYTVERVSALAREHLRETNGSETPHWEALECEIDSVDN